MIQNRLFDKYDDREDEYDDDDDLDDQEEDDEPVEIEPKIFGVSAAGELKIEFDPPNTVVPEGWGDLWDAEKRALMKDTEIE